MMSSSTNSSLVQQRCVKCNSLWKQEMDGDLFWAIERRPGPPAVSSQYFYPPGQVWHKSVDPDVIKALVGTRAVSNHRLIVQSKSDLLPSALQRSRQ
ncbi:hypothetical protein RB195_012889 [Necator americanus]|uniref:Uncharacterized protein n=1 Tax=Necator americanus TaxID=51031 RepID=A0ABR1DUH4_NECAM